MSQSEKKYLTNKELAARWGIERTTLYRWRREKKPLPKETSLGNNTRNKYAIEDVEAFEAANKVSKADTHST